MLIYIALCVEGEGGRMVISTKRAASSICSDRSNFYKRIRPLVEKGWLVHEGNTIAFSRQAMDAFATTNRECVVAGTTQCGSSYQECGSRYTGGVVAGTHCGSSYHSGVVVATQKCGSRYTHKKEEYKNTYKPPISPQGGRGAGEAQGFPQKVKGYDAPENWYEPEPEPERFPEPEAAPVPHPAQTPKPKATYPARFEEWWAAYPRTRRVAKPQCAKKWRNILASGTTEEELFLGLARWLNSHDWQKEGGQYVCQPATWLNQSRWNDTPIPAERRVSELGGFPVPEPELPSAQATPAAAAAKAPAPKAPPEETPTEDEALFLKAYLKKPTDFRAFRDAYAAAREEYGPKTLAKCAGMEVREMREREGHIRFLQKPETWLEERNWENFVGCVDRFEGLTYEEKLERVREERRTGVKFYP